MGLLGPLPDVTDFMGGGGLFGGGGDNGLAKLLAQMRRQQNLRSTQANAYGMQGLESLRSGYDEAIKNVGRTGLASKLNIEAAGQQTQGKIAQSYTSRGLSNSTAMGSVQALGAGQTAAALAGVDQAVSNAKAGLLSARGSALNQGYMGLADLQHRQLQGEMGLGQMAWQNLSSQQSEAEQLMGLFATVGQFLPMAFGMPPMPMMGGGGAPGGYTPPFPGGGF